MRNLIVFLFVLLVPLSIGAKAVDVDKYNAEKRRINSAIKKHPVLWEKSKTLAEFLASVKLLESKK